MLCGDFVEDVRTAFEERNNTTVFISVFNFEKKTIVI